jgi:O-antigen ligase
MWVFPFLNYAHAHPITTFYQEWWSALLGVLAMAVLLSPDYWRTPVVPQITVLPAALLVLVVVQWLSGKLPYFDQALLYALYFLFAALLMMAGSRLRECVGLPNLSLSLALALLIGAELNAGIGIVQHYRWQSIFDHVVIAKLSGAVYGNLAQPNHFANYVALGLISLGLLFQNKKTNLAYTALLALPLLFVMTVSGSRSSWLYLSLMAAMAWLYARRDAGMKPLLGYSLLLLAGFGLMHVVVQLQVMTAETGSVNTVARLLNREETGDIRLYLWHEAGLMLAQSPLLGAGFGQFAWQHFQMVPVLRPDNIVGLYNNAHNVVMNLGAETGLVGLLIFFVSLGIWIKAARHNTPRAAHWWGYSILGVLGVHSLLEYPLWYSYFLAIAAILLGIFDETRLHLRLRFVGRVSMAAILLLVLIVLLQLRVGYRNMERMLAESPASEANEKVSPGNTLAQLLRSPLLSPYAELFMSQRMMIDGQYPKQKLALNTRVLRFVPIGLVAYRQALLLAQDGQSEQAKRVWEQAMWSYPEDLPRHTADLVALATKDPTRFSALLEFALQQKQEQARAVFHQ